MSYLDSRDIDYDPPLIFRVNRNNYDQFVSTPGAGPLLAGQAMLRLTGSFQPEKRSEIGLFSSIVNYAWYNITAAYGNNQFSYTLGRSASNFTRNLTIPDGNYTPDELNAWFVAQQIANGDYVLTSTGVPVTFLSITLNNIQNGLTITAAVVTVPGGGSNPNSLTLAQTMLITVPTYLTNRYQTSFSILTGFTPGSYPATYQGTTQSFNSNQPVVFFPVQSVNVNCNFAGTGNYVQNDNVIFTFTTAGAIFGGPIQVVPPVIQWYPLSSNQQTTCVVTLTDQLGNFLQMTDNFMQFQIRVRVMTAYNRS